MTLDLARRLHRWRASLWPLPATSDGLAVLCCAAIIGARVASMVGLVIALPSSTSASSRPWLNLAVAGVFLVQSLLVIAVLSTTRTPVHRRLLSVDITVFAIASIAQQAFLGPRADVAGWDAWAYGTSLATILLAGVATSTPRSALTAAGTMVAINLLGGLPLTLPAGSAATTFSNTCFMFINILVVHGVWSFLRRLGARADLAQHEAERRGGATERARLKPMLHENAGLLSLLLRTPEAGTAATARSIRTMVGRLRAALEDREEPVPDTLSGVVEGVCVDFADLSVDVNTMLLEGVGAPPAQLTAARDTLTTVLANVRLHAEATQVIVLADAWADDDSTHWAVDVHDNGIGFDVDRADRRYGLGDQVEAMRRCGGDVHVTSVPGEGTTVRLSAHFPSHPTAQN